MSEEEQITKMRRRQTNSARIKSVAVELLQDRRGTLVPALTNVQRANKENELLLRLALEDELEE